jgi:putative spermidine/putrescine transport system permease protein
MKSVILLIFLILVFVLPLTILIIYSISGIWSFPGILPESLSLRSIKLLSDKAGPVISALFKSTFIALSTVTLSFFITVLPASVFSRYEFRLRRLLEALFLLPVLIPSITFSMGIHFLFLVIGIADTSLGVILVLTAFAYPYMLRSLMAGFSTYSPDFDRCAENLGAGLLRRIFQVHIPMLLPAILSGGTVVFLVAFSEYFLVFLIGGGVVNSYTGFLFPYLNSSDRSTASLLTLIFLIIPLVLFFIVDVSAAKLYRKRGMDF